MKELNNNYSIIYLGGLRAARLVRLVVAINIFGCEFWQLQILKAVELLCGLFFRSGAYNVGAVCALVREFLFHDFVCFVFPLTCYKGITGHSNFQYLAKKYLRFFPTRAKTGL
jgi:hypothetical protein